MAGPAVHFGRKSMSAKSMRAKPMRATAGMPRQCRTAVANGLTAAVLSVLSFTPPAAALDVACKAPQRAMQQVEMMFGRNIGSRLGVSDAAWSRFLAREVTPRFPNGLTVMDATGQWLGTKSHAVVREPSKLLIVVTPDDAAARDKLAAIVAAYKRQFRQDSVGVVTRPVCASF